MRLPRENIDHSEKARMIGMTLSVAPAYSFKEAP